MKRVTTGVSALVVLGALLPAPARGGEPSPDEMRAIAVITHGGGYATPGVGLIPAGMVVTAGDKTTDDDLKELHHLPGLTVLTLEVATLSDAGFAHLEGLDGVKVLGLANTRITDAGLAHLKAMRRLRSLDLSGTPITDAGVAHLVQMRGLRELVIRDTRISPEGRKTLRRSLRWCRIK
jgi:hypothetical protein